MNIQDITTYGYTIYRGAAIWPLQFRAWGGPEDLSGNLIVQRCLATEDLNRTSYRRNNGPGDQRPCRIDQIPARLNF